MSLWFYLASMKNNYLKRKITFYDSQKYVWIHQNSEWSPFLLLLPLLFAVRNTKLTKWKKKILIFKSLKQTAKMQNIDSWDKHSPAKKYFRLLMCSHYIPSFKRWRENGSIHWVINHFKSKSKTAQWFSVQIPQRRTRNQQYLEKLRILLWVMA